MRHTKKLTNRTIRKGDMKNTEWIIPGIIDVAVILVAIFIMCAVVK